jgi:desampylase
MPFAISRSLLGAILADCAADPARERCGLLLGIGETVLAVEPTANVAANPGVAFEIAPEALIAATRSARESGLAVVGHYHSHPNGLCEPSARDAVAADGDRGRCWLIVTPTGASVWRFTGEGPVHGFAPVPLAITDAAT